MLGPDDKPKLGRDGKPRICTKSATWYAVVGGLGDAISTGCRTEDGARLRLAELVKRAEHLRAGLLTAGEARTVDYQAAPLADHIAAYIAHLEAKGCTAAHRANVEGRLHRLTAECGFGRLRDLERGKLESWLLARAGEGMSARTRNAYGAAAVSFASWLVQTHRLLANPFARLAKACEAADPRRKRRSITEVELAALLDATRRRPVADFGRETVEGNRKAAPLTPATLAAAEAKGYERLVENPDFVAELERRGRERALLYKLLTLTGLRANEARSLTVGALDLKPANPYVVLAAADAKTREAAEIPLRARSGTRLSGHLAERLRVAQRAARRGNRPIPARLPDDAALLDVPAGLVKILDRDLAAAGLAKRDQRGRTIDVHAFRHTFNSLLAAAGVPLRTRQVLMRHASSGTLTDDVYSDPAVLDLRGALAKLPALPLHDKPHAGRGRATGTDLVAVTVAGTADDCRELLGIRGDSSGSGAGNATVSRTVASAVPVNANEQQTGAVGCSRKSGRQDLNLRPSAPHADALARLRHAPHTPITYLTSSSHPRQPAPCYPDPARSAHAIDAVPARLHPPPAACRPH